MLSITNHHHWPCSLFGVMWQRRASMKLVLNCKANKEGGKIKQFLRLVKHSHKFMEQLGKYAMFKGNPALRATNQYGECIFLMVNRILSSHSDIRAPIISGIVKMRAVGESFFKQLYDQYASPDILQQLPSLA